MSVTLLDGHVLFPFAPHWQTRPQIRRFWRSEVTGGVTGIENRSLLVPKPRHGLRWQVLPLDHAARADLVDSILMAKKTGLAAAPFWGRGSALTVAASGNSLTLASATAWAWGIGDPVFLSSGDAWELATVQGVAEATLALSAPLSRTYSHLAWPILFGEFNCAELAWSNLTHGGVTLELEQRAPFPDPVTLPDDTIDFDWIYDTFEGYAEGSATTLNRGHGWNGPWILDPPYYGEKARDELEGYADGANIHGLGGGEGFSGPWVVT